MRNTVEVISVAVLTAYLTHSAYTT